MESSPKKKYHVAENGDIYCINEDGSFTPVGGAQPIPPQPAPTPTPKPEPAPTPSPTPTPTPESTPEPEHTPEPEPTSYVPPRMTPTPNSKKSNPARMIILIVLGLLLIGAGITTYFFFPELFGVSKDDDVELIYEGRSNDDDDDEWDSEEYPEEAGYEETPIAEDTVPAEEVAPVIPEQTKPDAKSKEETKPKEDPRKKEETKKKEDPKSKSKESSAAKNEREAPSKPEPRREEPVKPAAPPVDDNKIYDSVDVLPQFPGGDGARRQWLRNNLQWPLDAEGNQLAGDVTVYFVIEKDGSISNVRVMSSTNSALNSAATSLIRRMPRWSPAKNKNKPVRTFSTITLYF